MLCPDIPILNSNVNTENRKTILEMLKKAKAKRLWLALDRYILFDKRADFEKLTENIRFFEESGIETGVWMQAFGFGGPLPRGEKRDWTRIKSLSGKQTDDDAFCPEDKGFIEAYCDWIRRVAETGTRLIMLDDDLCMSVRPGIGCFCDKHIDLLEQKVGKLPELEQIFTGSPNKYRDAYIEVMGDSMRKFCKSVRATVDSVDKTIRVGLCAGYTSWDIEGTDPIEMSRILAGKTKPFFRFTGAPYWVAPQRQRFNNQRLSAVIENARNQISWSKDTDIEYFAEADSYPRPAYHCSASLIENFDIAMQASGARSLKYIFDYYSSPEYEKQYYNFHIRNLPFYDKIQTAFENTVPCGVRLYRPYHRLKDITFPDAFIGEKQVMTKSYFSSAATMLSALGIPTCYDGESDFAIFFGDDALQFENKHKKIILDLPAALKLQKQGIDVGIKSITSIDAPFIENFENERIPLFHTEPDAEFYNLELKEAAKIHSRFDTGAVASFEYGKFLVLNFDSLYVGEGSTLLCSYERGRQIADFIGNAFPVIQGYADIYCICAQSKKGHSVLFQNLSADPVYDFFIKLPKCCKDFKLYNAKGRLEGEKIHVDTEFYPSSSILLEIEYL